MKATRGVLSIFMSVVLVVGLCPGLANADSGGGTLAAGSAVTQSDGGIVSAQSVVKAQGRTSAPDRSNKYYYNSAYNPYYPGYVGQCTWYAQGRASEILGKKYVQRGYNNGGQFWQNNYLYSTGQTPKVGAIACAGPYSNSAPGHVAVVEEVFANGSFKVSEYYGSNRDNVFRYNGPYANGAAWAKASTRGRNSFQGFIYLIANPPSTTKAPTIKPYDVLGGKKIQLVDNQGGASIRYTVDGKTNPTNTVGTLYNGNWIDDTWATMGVRAIAYKSGLQNSSVVGKTNYTGLTAAPTITQNNTATGATIQLASSTKSSTIFYTTDGTVPTFDIHSGTSNGKKYTGAFQISQNCTIKAIAVSSGNRASSVASKDITCVVPEEPEVSIEAGKIAQGDAAKVKWERDATAASYIAALYKGDELVDTQTVSSPEATFVIGEAGNYTIGVKATNAIGSSEESERVAVEAVAPRLVRFMSVYTDENGSEVSRVDNEQQVKYGYSATRPATSPKRRGYTFAGWDRSFDRVTEDTDVTALWEINEYVVQFYSADGATRLSRQVVKFNEEAEAPNPGAAPAGKVFAGWAVTNASDDSSARDYKKVDSNMTLRAVFSWTDEELPVVAEITNAERTASGNYTVNVKLTNYPTDISTAILRVALKTSGDKLVQTSRETVEIGTDSTIEKTVTLKYNGNYIATIAEVEVIGIDGNYRTGGAYSAAVKKDIVSMDNFYYTDWSEWSTEKPVASDTVEVEEAVQYRSRDKLHTTSTSTALAGWERDGTSTTTVGEWSGEKTTTSKPTASDTLKINGQSTKYTYYRWCNYYSNMWQQDSIAYGSKSAYHEVSLSSPMTACPNKFGDQGGKKADLHGPYGSCTHKVSGQSYWWTKSIVTTYRYQTRSKTVTYGFWKWDDWADWGFDEVSETSDRGVEQRTVYRYRTKMPGQIQGEEDATGTKQSVSGTLGAASDLSGKEATIMVYNVTNTDPNEDQIQYIGQTKIDAGNAYSFEFTPRQDPSVESGDFIVALGVKGATGLVNVATIKAPRAQYKVTYQWEKPDGAVEVVSEQMVYDGDDAEVPEAPERAGCTFLGWSRSASRVNNDLVISALYSARTCTVAWVDHQGEDVFLQTCDYGQTLTAPVEQPEMDGYTFKGWDALIDGATTVTENMVVTAVFEPVKHTVMFVDADGAAFKTVQVEHGKAAELPDTNPTAPGMEFVSWGTTNETPWWSVTRDLVVKPLFAYEGTVSSPYSSVELAKGYVSAKGTKVYLETPTDGSKIYYTVDGSDPAVPENASAGTLGRLSVSSLHALAAGEEIEEPVVNTTIEYDPEAGITVTKPTKIRAMACAEGMNDSSIADFDVDVTATNDISNADAGVAEAPFYYGEAVEPGVMVWLGDELLVCNEDYTIEYSDNDAIGMAYAHVKGIGSYTGEQTVEFEIVEPPEDEDAVPISSATVSAIPAATFTGSAIAPKLVVTYEGETLTLNSDYTLSYKNNVNAGTATVAVSGTGRFTGTKTVTFKINAASVANASVTSLVGKVYSGSAQTQSPTVRVGSTTLKPNIDYTLTYTNNVNAGTATVAISGRGNYAGSVSETFTIAPAENPMSIAAKVPSMKYSKKKAQVVKAAKAYSFKKKAVGAVTYARVAKGSSKWLPKVNAKTGAITVKAGAPKGKTQAIKVKVTAKGNDNYKALSKTIAVKVKVK